MYRIIVFGTGKSSEKVIDSMRMEHIQLICFIDNNKEKENKKYDNTDIMIHNVAQVHQEQFDYVIIASIFPQKMQNQLLEEGIPDEKIIPYFMLNKREVRQYSELFMTEGLMYDILECKYDKKINEIKSHIDNLAYELYDKLQASEARLPNIKTLKKTMEELEIRKCSLSRVGDGEFMLMLGRGINFQKYDALLAERLESVLKCKNENCMVAISSEFGALDFFNNEKSKDDIRVFLRQDVRNSIYEKLDFAYEYGNAFVTRPYMFLNTDEEERYYFESFKKLWNHKNLLVVEGNRTYFGVHNDLIENAKMCKRIVAPGINAFSEYTCILKAAKEYLCDKDKNEWIVLTALGPTATVLAYDISKLGYRIIDIGHLDLEYEWYLRGAKKAVLIENKYCDAVEGGNRPQRLADEQYEQQVVCRIGNE